MKHRRRLRSFHSRWIFEAFDRDPSFMEKRMFGCLAAYLRGRLVMLFTEDPGDRSYRGRHYSFDLWDGLLLPTERAHHASLIREFPGLRPHPVLGKWLYLPATDENFEMGARDLAEKTAQGDPRLGIDPQISARPARRRKKENPVLRKDGVRSRVSPKGITSREV